MGNGSSGRRKNKTPSGVTYEQFMKMSKKQRYDLIDKIIKDENIKVPDYLDDSYATKVMYGLGMTNKPTIISDAELDKIKGQDLFRTVYDTDKGITGKQIIEQIKTSDFTQMSGSGGSVFGKALYFAENYSESAYWGESDKNPVMMRVKIKSDAKTESYRVLIDKMKKNKIFREKIEKNPRMFSIYDSNAVSLYAISHGLDGWYDIGRGFTMIINRGALAVSSTTKKAITENSEMTWKRAPEA